MTHASRGHTCELCGRVAFGNGGQVSHGRGHVRRGEAVELVKVHGFPMTPSRLFLRPDDARVTEFRARGFEVVR
jgi:hypothetical protein